MFLNFYRATTLSCRISPKIRGCRMTTAVQNNTISPRRIIVRENKRRPPKTSTTQSNQSMASPSTGMPLSLRMEEALRVLRAYSLERFDETVQCSYIISITSTWQKEVIIFTIKNIRIVKRICRISPWYWEICENSGFCHGINRDCL